MRQAADAVAAPAAIEPVRVDLSVDLAPSRPGSLVLRNPVMAAAGPFGFGLEYAELIDVERLGAICSKGTTRKPRSGNPPARMAETPGGLLNSIGLQNPGVDAVVERYAPVWAEWQVPVVVNVAGETIDDYVAVVHALEDAPGIAGIELNISCPNTGRGGIQFALDADAAGELTRAVRAATELPLLVKLSPAAQDVRAVARAVEEAGADAITAVNTLPAMAIDRARQAPLLGAVYGGLSGPALKPVALRVVYEVAQVVDIPIVGVGGIGSLEDVLEFLMAGAVAVQVGTALFADPLLPARLIDELGEWCRGQGHDSHLRVVGRAQPAYRDRPSTRGAEYRP